MSKGIIAGFVALWVSISVLFYVSVKYFAYNLWPGNEWFTWFKWIYIAAELAVIAQLAGTVRFFRQKDRPAVFTINTTMVLLLLWLLPRLAFIAGTWVLAPVLGLGWKLFTGSVNSQELLVTELGLALALTLGVLVAVLRGLTSSKYDYKVKRLTLAFSNLPTAFDGFTITQFSDLHAGSLDVNRAAKGIELIKRQKSDLILFTGDMVNNAATELEGWGKLLSGLSAPYGMYSILGNHDYGDYMQWPGQGAKAANLERLKNAQRTFDFNLLLNEHHALAKDGQQIYLAGVENWGAKGFAKYGNLPRAMAGIPEDAFTILLSHDPSHWEAEVLKFKHVPDLTLSGHTHGFQFGINLFNWMWSPIKWFYKHWGGLYREGHKYLYINLGFGFHGLPGRIGMRPEITVITLAKKNAD